MKTIIIGGDGFCGWPTALHLSKIGYEVLILDNLSRRKIDIDLGVESLTPIKSIDSRIGIWKEITQRKMEFINIDVSKDYNRLLDIIKNYKPDTIIHFGEQRSAPYSMKNSRTKIYTVDNNINATNNVLNAVIECKLDIHIIHLGTMGVYGYSTAGMRIPEGYIEVDFTKENGQKITKEILYPPDPGSVYHLTKTQDAALFNYYNKNDGIRITDLHQGVVWGVNTEETILHEGLINRFDYDGDYGTVLNRFLIQAALDFPLTVHGKGGQTRAFININDTVRCLELAIKNPPKKVNGKYEVKILNQMTEVKTVKELAHAIQKKTNSKILFLKNPRNESDYNDLSVKNEGLLNLGLKPIFIKDNLLEEIQYYSKKYIHRCNKSKIYCTSYWNAEIKKKFLI